MLLIPVALTKQEAAQALKCSVRTLERLIRNGELTARRIGARVIVPVVAIEAFLKKDHPTR